jgi:hypothetical protein
MGELKRFQENIDEIVAGESKRLSRIHSDHLNPFSEDVFLFVTAVTSFFTFESNRNYANSFLYRHEMFRQSKLALSSGSKIRFKLSISYSIDSSNQRI